MTDWLDPIRRLNRDLKTAAVTLSHEEARFLVDSYYAIQEYRKAAFNQERALEVSEEPHLVITWLAEQMNTLERQVQRALDSWSSGSVTGCWLKACVGIGPVIAAGLLAHLDIERCPTVGCFWRFGGVDPTVEWLGKERSREVVTSVVGTGKDVSVEQLAVIANLVNRKAENIAKLAKGKDGEEDLLGPVKTVALIAALAKRPWNTPLRTLLWKVGESFVKVQNNPNDTYGRLLAERKVKEWNRNLKGELAERAMEALEKKNIGRTTEAYKWYSGGYIVPPGYKYQGATPELLEGHGTPMLPPAHIHARAKRWAVKLFLSAFHEVAYFTHYGILPPKPYVLTHLGHTGYIAPPNMHLVAGLAEAHAAAHAEALAAESAG